MAQQLNVTVKQEPPDYDDSTDCSIKNEIGPLESPFGIQNIPKDGTLECGHCGKKFTSVTMLNEHAQTHINQTEPVLKIKQEIDPDIFTEAPTTTQPILKIKQEIKQEPIPTENVSSEPNLNSSVATNIPVIPALASKGPVSILPKSKDPVSILPKSKDPITIIAGQSSIDPAKLKAVSQFICGLCSQRFNSFADVTAHVAVHIPKPMDGNMNVQYLKAGDTAVNVRVQTPVTSNQADPNVGRAESNNVEVHFNGQKLYPCLLCPEKFTEYAIMLKHRYSHNEPSKPPVFKVPQPVKTTRPIPASFFIENSSIHQPVMTPIPATGSNENATIHQPLRSSGCFKEKVIYPSQHVLQTLKNTTHIGLSTQIQSTAEQLKLISQQSEPKQLNKIMYARTEPKLHQARNNVVSVVNQVEQTKLKPIAMAPLTNTEETTGKEFNCILCHRKFPDVSSMLLHRNTHINGINWNTSNYGKHSRMSETFAQNVKPTIIDETNLNQGESGSDDVEIIVPETIIPVKLEEAHCPTITAESITPTDELSDICMVAYGSEMDLKQDTWNGGTYFECNQCHKKFSKMKEHDTHVQSHIVYFPCRYCQKTFTSFILVNMHIKTFHPEMLETFQCLKCPKKFELEIHLIEHQMAHNRFQCSMCPKKFEYEIHLIEHQIAHKMFQCSKCPKKFALEAGLVEHMKSHKDFKCAKCPRKFALETALVEHQKIHKDLKCSKCSKKFALETELCEHEKTHKKFQCAKCFKKFQSDTLLAEHEKCHKRFKKCLYCSNAFEITDFYTPTTSKSTKQGDSFKPMYFGCKVCHQQFSDKIQLDLHETRHKQDACDACLVIVGNRKKTVVKSEPNVELVSDFEQVSQNNENKD